MHREEKEINPVKSAVMIESSSESLSPFLYKGPLPVWLPVVVSCTKVVFDAETKARFKDCPETIRGCDISVRISQCRLLDLNNGNKGKIFFSGYIKESVEYLELDNNHPEAELKNIRLFSAKIPFETLSDIDYYLPPRLKETDRILIVELVPGIYTMRHNVKYEEKQEPQDFLQCEILEIRVRDVGFTKGYAPEELTGRLIVSITFLLTQKQCICIG